MVTKLEKGKDYERMYKDAISFIIHKNMWTEFIVWVGEQSNGLK